MVNTTDDRMGDDTLLMEVGWEVCNQVGGIYTVLRSKVPSMMRRWGDRYCLVGPYDPRFAEVEFEAAPLVGPVGKAVKRLQEMGYRAHFGRWLVSGRPQVVLLEVESVARLPADLVFALFAPEHAGVDHLKALALESRTMRDPGLCAKLRANDDAATLYALLTDTQ